MTHRRKNFKILKFARIVSYIFDGSVLVWPIFLAICFYGIKNVSEVIPSFMIAIMFTALIPYVAILILYKAGKVSDLQIPRRKERLLPLLIINACIVMGFFILINIQPARMLLSVYMIYLLSLPVISLITLFWKISFHASYITLFSIVFLFVFGKWAIATLPLIPLVGWSRIKLKKHTLAQVLAGITLISTISLTIFYLRGYLTSDYNTIGELSWFLRNSSDYLGLILPGFELTLIFILVYVFIRSYIRTRKEKP